MIENEKLEWEEVSCEHIVNDEWIDFKYPENVLLEYEKGN